MCMHEYSLRYLNRGFHFRLEEVEGKESCQLTLLAVIKSHDQLMLKGKLANQVDKHDLSLHCKMKACEMK